LGDAGAVDLPDEPVPVEVRGIEVPSDWRHVRSSETYVGLARSEGFAALGDAAFDEPRAYEVPSRLQRNEWALAGTWTLGREEAVCNEPNGRIAYRFHARDLNLILVAPANGATRFRVRLDGVAPGDAHGIDTDTEGNGTVSDARLYQLIRLPDDVDDRLFEIEFLDAGASALCFTFG